MIYIKKLSLNSLFVPFLAIRVMLRGKCNAEWKVVVSGDRRTVKDDQIFIDERTIIWGKGYNFYCSDSNKNISALS